MGVGKQKNMFSWCLNFNKAKFEFPLVKAYCSMIFPSWLMPVVVPRHPDEPSRHLPTAPGKTGFHLKGFVWLKNSGWDGSSKYWIPYFCWLFVVCWKDFILMRSKVDSNLSYNNGCHSSSLSYKNILSIDLQMARNGAVAKFMLHQVRHSTGQSSLFWQWHPRYAWSSQSHDQDMAWYFFMDAKSRSGDILACLRNPVGSRSNVIGESSIVLHQA